jgi:membrane protein
MGTLTWPHGRHAVLPRKIPVKGIKDTIMRVKTDIKKDRLSMVSAAMAYYALFSIVPSMTSVILIYAWVSDPTEISQHVAKVSNLIPPDMLKIVNAQLTALASNASVGLGAIFSLLISLWSASKAAKALMEALNIINGEEEERGFLKLNAIAIGLTLLGAVLSIVAIGVVVAIPALAAQLDFGELFEIGITAASWLILLTLFACFLQVGYRYGPDRRKAKWRWVSPGAMTASVLWALASILFSWYAAEFGNYNKAYGSLGAIIVMMLWFYITSFVILIGGAINAELEHHTIRDTTIGLAKPIGLRGARMANTLGINIFKKKRWA